MIGELSGLATILAGDMARIHSLRTLSLAAAFAAVGAAQAQSYYSSDNSFCSPNYHTTSPVSFAGGGGSGKVNVQDLSFTKRTALSLDGAVHHYDFDFSCLASWSWGATNSGSSGSGGGSGKCSFSMQYDGQSKEGAYLFSGQLSSFACVVRDSPRKTMIMQSAPTLDSIVRFSYSEASPPTGSVFTPNIAGFLVQSSFDSSLQASIDNGTTWSTSDSSAHFQGTPEPASIAALGLGIAAIVRRRKANRV